MAAPNGTQREKLNFSTMHTPILLTLENDGKAAPGKFGLQYLYFFDRGRVAWVDPPIHDHIQQSGAHAGDTIKVSRHETRVGNRRGPLTWAVHLATQPQDEPPAAQEEMDLATVRRWEHERLKATIGTAPARPAASQPAPQSRPLASQPAPRTATTPAQGAAAEQHPLSTRTAAMAAALAAAVDAAATAESYAEAHGKRITFSSEDIRAIAATIYIGAPGGAR